MAGAAAQAAQRAQRWHQTALVTEKGGCTFLMLAQVGSTLLPTQFLLQFGTFELHFSTPVPFSVISSHIHMNI